MQEKKLLSHTSLIRPSEFIDVVLSCNSESSRSPLVNPSVIRLSEAIVVFICDSGSAKSGAPVLPRRALSPFNEVRGLLLLI